MPTENIHPFREAQRNHDLIWIAKKTVCDPSLPFHHHQPAVPKEVMHFPQAQLGSQTHCCSSFPTGCKAQEDTDQYAAEKEVETSLTEPCRTQMQK